MLIQPTTADRSRDRSSERGAALIMALMVSLVLVFLGMGLLLQTSLGLQAAGTDRWVTKALYAADAGAMMQIEMIQLGALGAAPGASGTEVGTFILEDDPGLQGMLKGQFSVTISRLLRIAAGDAGDRQWRAVVLSRISNPSLPPAQRSLAGHRWAHGPDPRGGGSRRFLLPVHGRAVRTGETVLLTRWSRGLS